jgi:hypothetical protein
MHQLTVVCYRTMHDLKLRDQYEQACMSLCRTAKHGADELPPDPGTSAI